MGQRIGLARVRHIVDQGFELVSRLLQIAVFKRRRQSLEVDFPLLQPLLALPRRGTAAGDSGYSADFIKRIGRAVHFAYSSDYPIGGACRMVYSRFRLTCR